MKKLLSVFVLGLMSLAGAVRADTSYDYELTEKANSLSGFVRAGANCGDCPAQLVYKVGVLKGETVTVTISFSRKEISCSSGAFEVYRNGTRCTCTGAKYVITLTDDTLIKLMVYSGSPSLISAIPRQVYASTYYTQVDYEITASIPKRCIVSYNPGSDGVTGSAMEEKFAGGTQATLKDEIYYRTGYRQSGWTESDGGTKKYGLGALVAADQNYTLYPAWQKAITYTITYKGDSYSSGSATAGTKTQGVPFTLLAKAPFTRTDYVQRGWSRTLGGGCDFALGATYTTDANLVLYPYWETSVPKLTFLPGTKGTGDKLVLSKSLDKVFVLPGAIYTRSGYRQIGWVSAAGIRYGLFAGYTVNADVTFYPVWARDPAADKLYMVIDLSAGTDATSYPVSYLSSVPAGGWTDEYKTKKLVLVRIASQTNSVDGTARADTTIAKPYYAGVFEVTQRQYELVTGKRPETSYPNQYKLNDTLPERVLTYRDLHSRYANGAYRYAAVPADGFFDRVRTRTGLEKLDVPTGVQWKYAARSGSWDIPYGICYDAATQSFKTDSGNSSHTAEEPVGSDLPNCWGLYGMAGGAREWCSDWSGYGDGLCYAICGGVDVPVSKIDYVPATTYHAGFRVFCETEEIGTLVEEKEDSCDTLGHISYVSKAAQAATTTAAGWTEERRCSRCGIVLQASTTIPKLEPESEPSKPNLRFCTALNWPSVHYMSATSGSYESSNSFMVGNPIYMNVCLQNNGDADISTPYVIRYELLNSEGKVLDTWNYTDSSVVPASSTDCRCWFGYSWAALSNLPAGTYTQRVTLDATSVLDEKDETDNVSECTFTVVDPPAVSTFTITFNANGGSGAMTNLTCKLSAVRTLPRCNFNPPTTGKRFAGWRCSNGKRYDDGVLVFNLAPAGETVTMTAIWE